jgi:phage terminase large subunit-like protein
MPWQRLVADVGLELIDGHLAYREVWVSVPRQNGKTTLVLAWEVDRAVGWGKRQRIVYSAQDGNAARRKLLEDQVPLLRESPFWALIGDDRVRRAAGSESVGFRTGSRIEVLSNSKGAGHGRTLDLGVIDEAFDDDDDRREQAILPAMQTRRDGQLFGCSTMGTEDSVYLNRKVDAGREFAAADSDLGNVAYFEWSAPDESDPDDPATWRACMPAYDITIGENAVRHARQTMRDGEFRRAFLNQRTASDERVIPEEAWDAVCDPACQPDGYVTFAIDCNPERTSASIAVADPSGNVELVDTDRGTGWLIPRARSLSERWGAAVAVDPAGPAGSFIAELESAGIKVVPVGGQEFTKACGGFFTAVGDQKLRVHADDRLNVAVAAAKKRPVGDAWVWARKTTQTDISPLVAVTIAHWAATSLGLGAPECILLSEV